MGHSTPLFLTIRKGKKERKTKSSSLSEKGKRYRELTEKGRRGWRKKEKVNQSIFPPRISSEREKKREKRGVVSPLPSVPRKKSSRREKTKKKKKKKKGLIVSIPREKKEGYGQSQLPFHITN